MNLSPDTSLRQLVAFEAAARHRSYTRAAGELGVDRSAALQLVARLTKSIDRGALLVRDGMGITTTPLGADLYERVVTALALLRSEPPPSTGDLRFSAFPAQLVTAAPLLRAFELSTGTKVKVTAISDDLRADGGTPLANLLATRQIDVAILPALQIPEGCTSKPLYRWSLQAAVVPGHPLASRPERTTVTVKDLRTASLLTSPARHSTHRFVIEAFASAGFTPDIEIEAADPLVLLALLRQHPASVAIIASDTIGVPTDLRRLRLKAGNREFGGAYVAATPRSGGDEPHALLTYLGEHWADVNDQPDL